MIHWTLTINLKLLSFTKYVKNKNIFVSVLQEISIEYFMSMSYGVQHNS